MNTHRIEVTAATMKLLEAVALRVVAGNPKAGASRREIEAALDGHGIKFGTDYAAAQLHRVLTNMLDAGKLTAVGVHALLRYRLAGPVNQAALDAGAKLLQKRKAAPAIAPDLPFVRLVVD